MKKFFSALIAVLIFILPMTVSAAALGDKTSTEYLYEKKFLSSKLFYNDLAMITDSFCAIPGLKNTNVNGENCSTMTPQGLCVTEQYIFISAYCGAEKFIKELKENIDYGLNSEKLETEKTHKAHNSVIYIIDRKTGAYIKNIVLPDYNHVGGLATDGKVIYIAKSSDKQISVIKLSAINKALSSKSPSVKVKYDYTVNCGCQASFVTYFKDKLWIGEFKEKGNGMLRGFDVGKSYKLSEKISVEIPAKANGATFAELNGEICLAVSSSYGRKNVSQLYLCSVSDYGTINMTVTEKAKYILPPLSQNICIYGENTYCIFESASACYSRVDSDSGMKATSCVVDRVCIGDVRRLFNWHSQENIIATRITLLVDAFKNFATALIS